MKDRLQIRHSNQIFATRDEAIAYLHSQMIYVEGKKALFAEPLVIKYGDDEANPNIILAIGSYGNGIDNNFNNKYFIIDTATIEKDIAKIKEELNGNAGEIAKIKDDIESLKEKDNQLSIVLGQVGEALQFEIDRAKAAEKTNADNISINSERISNEIKRSTDKDTEHDLKIKENSDAILAEVNRAESVEKSITVFTQDTDTIKLTKVNSNTGTTISGTLKLSSLTGNQLIVSDTEVGGGLYHNVDLTYQTGDKNGVLTLMVNGNPLKTINLPLEQFLKRAYYDDVRKELVLVFTTEGQGDEEVRINVGDLVNTYTAGLGLNLLGHEFSLKLNKTASEKFISLNEEGLALNGIQTAINDTVKIESDRAQAAEKNNNDAIIANTKLINNEISRATKSENDIDTKLSTAIEKETARATNAENSLDTKIVSETTRATDAESKIGVAISANTSLINELSGKTETLNVNLNNEVTRATDAEGKLNTAISAEVQRATGRENTIEASVTLNTEHIHTLGEQLGLEITRATNAEKSNTDAISAETSRAMNIESGLTTGLAEEKIRAVAAEEALSNKITSENVKTLNDAKLYTDSKVIELNTEISRVDSKSITASASNSTMVLSSTRETNGNVAISGKVNISGANKLIEVKEDGISVELGVGYKDGILTLSGSNGFSASTNLSIGGLIQDVTYKNQLLVITFKKEGGDVETVTIDLHELVTDWVINNDKELSGKKVSVQLYKEHIEGQLDQLYGDVKMVDLNYVSGDTITNNILGKAKDGRLFVDGTTEHIKHETQNLNTVINDNITKIQELKNKEIVGGQFNQNEKSLYLNHADGTSIIVGDFNIVSTALDGVSARTDNTANTITLVDKNGNTVTIDLSVMIQNAVNKAVSQAINNAKNEIISNTVFKQKITGDTDVTVDIVDGTSVTIGLGENCTIASTEYSK